MELSAEAWRCLGRLSSEDFRLVENAAWSLADLSAAAPLTFEGAKADVRGELIHDVGRFRIRYEVDGTERVVRLLGVTERTQAEGAPPPLPTTPRRRRPEEG